MKPSPPDWADCPNCGGSGKEIDLNQKYACCHGRGRISPEPARYRDCGRCEGTGYFGLGHRPSPGARVRVPHLWRHR
jgi:hypothetical protein